MSLSPNVVAPALFQASDEELLNVRDVLSEHEGRHGYALWQSTIREALVAFDAEQYHHPAIAQLLAHKDLGRVLQGAWYLERDRL